MICAAATLCITEGYCGQVLEFSMNPTVCFCTKNEGRLKCTRLLLFRWGHFIRPNFPRNSTFAQRTHGMVYFSYEDPATFQRGIYDHSQTIC